MANAESLANAKYRCRIDLYVVSPHRRMPGVQIVMSVMEEYSSVSIFLYGRAVCERLYQSDSIDRMSMRHCVDQMIGSSLCRNDLCRVHFSDVCIQAVTSENQRHKEHTNNNPFQISTPKRIESKLSYVQHCSYSCIDKKRLAVCCACTTGLPFQQELS